MIRFRIPSEGSATEFPNDTCEWERKSKDDSKSFVLSNLKDVIATSCDGHVNSVCLLDIPGLVLSRQGNACMCSMEGTDI